MQCDKRQVDLGPKALVTIIKTKLASVSHSCKSHHFKTPSYLQIKCTYARYHTYISQQLVINANILSRQNLDIYSSAYLPWGGNRVSMWTYHSLCYMANVIALLMPLHNPFRIGS